MFIRSFPENLDLLVFFEGEPIFQNAPDLHFAYKYIDTNQMSIIFSFSATAGWVQAVIEFQNKEVSRYLMEGVEAFKLEKDINGEYLSAEVELEDTRTNIEIRLKPFISVKFATLIR